MIYQAKNLQVKPLANGLAELCFCAPASVNKLDRHTIQSLDAALDALAADPSIKGLILSSDKPAFIVGADIGEFLSMFAKPESELDQWLQFANSIFNKLEDLPFPTISVLKGHALGGGCECVLATDFRIGDHTTNIGLPETKLGIMPGFGGSVRLPRLLGADSALDIITQGKTCPAEQALQLGLLDALVESDQLIASAIAILTQALSGKLDRQQRRQQKIAPLTLSKLEALMCFTTAKGVVAQVASQHYPAPLTAINAIEQAASLSRQAALDIERKHFIQLAKSSQAEALVGIFLNDQYIKGLAKQSSTAASQPTHHAAVIGAGIMGGGIAYQSAFSGVPIFIKDLDPTRLKQAMTEAAKLLNKPLAHGKLDSFKVTQILADITPSLHYAGIEQADVVIEAVVENPQVKAALLSEVETYLKPNTILASNTSTIPINWLAKSLQRPDNFCGMHFFNPVHRMPLVEIIRGEHTSPDAIHRMVAYATKMGKSPIVVNDGPGFFVNRVLFAYLAGFSLLMRDGASFTAIDHVMEQQFGWPMGPAYLLDVIGIDTAHHAQGLMAQGLPARMAKQYPDVIDALYQAQRLGQKSGCGFYHYTADDKGKPIKTFDADVLTILASVCGAAQHFDPPTIIERTMIPMINEVVICLEQEIVASAAEADMALVYGLGFPAFRGGVLRYLDQLGIANYVTMVQQYAHLGPLYHVPERLNIMAKQGETFYHSSPIGTLSIPKPLGVAGRRQVNESP